MKTVHLTEDLIRFLHEAVHSGRYASEDSVISDALIRLRQEINARDMGSSSGAGFSQSGKLLTKQVFQKHLVEIGLLDPPVQGSRDVEKPEPSANDDEDQILSEVVIRERLIEWLTGFLEK